MALAADPLPPLRDSARGPILAGCLVIAAFFGGLGGWAALAPLNGAVVGEAMIKVEGNRKAVEHLDGGIVQSILVKEGDHVRKGDVLIVLDDSQVRSEWQIYATQYAMLQATEARLLAELARSQTIAFPAELEARRDDPQVAMAIDSQRREFDTRQSAVAGQEELIHQRISQFEEQVTSAAALAAAYRIQMKSIVEEEQSLSTLLDKGLTTRTRMLELQRIAAGLDGQIAEAEANAAQARQAIGEQYERIGQIWKDRAAEVTAALRDTQTRMLDLGPRLHNAETQLGRMEVRSPYGGTVVGLKVFAVGAVIGRGDRILDIVPDDSPMVVEAHLRVEDISDVSPGMAAEVHFPSYRQRSIPLIHGRVTDISADRLSDERTGMPYYVADVEVDRQDLAASPQIRLYPGMPATVMIPTESRTALDYLIGPLTAAFDTAFRQR